ncbi:MAG TPA: histidine kinase, partial [Puia sp.]|nr:histidine kinase [Puia sp.]
EYDNDRIRRHTNKTEIVAWSVLVLAAPLINFITVFIPGDPAIGLVLLLVSLLLFPAYLLYSRFIVPRFLFVGRPALFVLLSIACFLVIQLLVFSIYSVVLSFTLSPVASSWFSFHFTSVIRESLWAILNLFLTVAAYFIKKANDEKDLISDIRKDNTFFKLRYLRAQLNPHFLFNTLNSIYSLSLQKSDKAPEVVVKLADIMRYLIYECNEEKILLDKEIEFIRNYIEIEKIRYKADIRFTVEGLTKDIMIEPFLFISFVENGFKHALDNSFAEPFIYITLKVGQDQIVLNVINSTNSDLGVQAKRMSGKGISNSRSLLELLYPDAYELDIIQTEREENRTSQLRMRNAKERLETLYPDSHTLDVILSKNAFTVSLIIKPRIA